jgi:hypothetical protein
MIRAEQQLCAFSGATMHTAGLQNQWFRTTSTQHMRLIFNHHMSTAELLTFTSVKAFEKTAA